LNLLIVPEAAQPADLRLAPKPSHLPLGVVTVSLLCGVQRLFPRKFAAKKLHSLFIAE
jgi:hypothetical protein